MGAIAVTGASGFIGRHVVKALVRAGHRVRAQARSAEKAREAGLGDTGVSLVVGDVRDAGVCDELVRGGGGGGCEAVVNCVGILRENGMDTYERVHVEGVKTLVGAMEKAGVARLVHVSAVSARSDGASGYHTSKWEGEQVIGRSGLAWTVLRCGFVFGAESEFVRMVAGIATGKRAPYWFLPFFMRAVDANDAPLSRREFQDPLVAPVDVRDVASLCVACLSNATTEGEIYNVVGPERLTWRDALEEMRDVIPGSDRTMSVWGLPGDIAMAGAKVARQLGMRSMVPFCEAEVALGTDDCVADTRKLMVHFGGMEMRGFREALAEYAPAMKC